jgi:hypothetical protein
MRFCQKDYRENSWQSAVGSKCLPHFHCRGWRKPIAMNIYRENRIQESEFRIQEKSSSCLFSSTGVTELAMSIYRENALFPA